MNVDLLLATFGLDRARIVAKASATEDYARILSARASEDPAAAEALSLRAASAATIAGSLWMLVHPGDAAAPLSQAEAIHNEIGSAYGSLLSICAHPRRPAAAHPLPSHLWDDPDTERRDEPERGRRTGPAFTRLQPAASLLAHLWPLAAGQTEASLDELLADAPILRELPDSWLTGRLRIPMGRYRGLATDVDALHGDRLRAQRGGRNRLPAAATFIVRAAETIAAARENRYEWRTLRSPILPAEPEVMAACALVEMTARAALDSSALDVMGLSTESLAGALMGVAQNLVDANPEPELAR